MSCDACWCLNDLHVGIFLYTKMSCVARCVGRRVSAPEQEVGRVWGKRQVKGGGECVRARAHESTCMNVYGMPIEQAHCRGIRATHTRH